MINSRYIRFKIQEIKTEKSKNNVFWNLIGSTLSKNLPKANPDFDEQIHKVRTWLVELDKEGTPEREVGLNENDVPIMKMPWKKNYGYWTDNHLNGTDFDSHFETQEISKVEFEDFWNKYSGLGFHCLAIENFSIKSTGVDGGHKYISTTIERSGKLFPLTVYFANKKDEELLSNSELNIEGILYDDGNGSSYSLLNAVLIKK